VLIGRPVVQALAVAGAHGVAHVLRLLRDELEIAMALTGCSTLDQVGRRVVELDTGQVRDQRSGYSGRTAAPRPFLAAPNEGPACR
jgi:4-hydroxymandelate oxidase